MSIALLGSGVRGRSDITLGTIQKLRRSQAVYFFSSVEISSEWLLGTVGVRAVEDLAKFYVEGGVDHDNYNRIADYVLAQEAALGDVAVLLPGHPLLGVTISQLLLERCSAAGIDISVCDGISSFDSMFTDLRRDPLGNSSVLLDANRLLLHQYQLDSRFDLYVYHVCSVGTARTNRARPELGNRLDLLAAALTTSLGSRRPAAMLHSGITGRLDIAWQGILEDLPAAVSTVTFADTLFVPGSDENLTRDSSFARLLELSRQ